MIKGESLVTGLEESADSITRKRANVVEGIEYSDSESESESTRLAFFSEAIIIVEYSSPMLPTHLGAQQGDMIWGDPTQIMTRIHR